MRDSYFSVGKISMRGIAVNQFFRIAGLLCTVTVLLLSAVTLTAEAAPGNGNGNANGHGNGNGPKKTPGLALVAVAALSSASYMGYKRLKK